MCIEPLGPSDEVAFAALLGIYEAAIPAAERKPPAALRAMRARPGYAFHVAGAAAGEVVGFAITFAPERAGFALLEYLAVDGARRGGGVGAALVRHVAASMPGRALLMEVEADDGTPERQRRLRFYAHLGCRQIPGLDYLLPLATAAGPPPRMALLVLADSPPRSIPIARLRAWLGAIYREVYGQRDDDPRIARMLAPLADPVPLEP